jgi:hypothetical protein
VVCENSTIISSFPVALVGSNFLALDDGTTSATLCNITGADIGMVWYEIVFPDASEVCATASIQTSNYEMVALSLYSGSSCDSLTCAAQSVNGQNKLVWKGGSVERYYLTVSQFNNNKKGDFTLNIKVRWNKLSFLAFSSLSQILFTVLVGGLPSK